MDLFYNDGGSYPNQCYGVFKSAVSITFCFLFTVKNGVYICWMFQFFHLLVYLCKKIKYSIWKERSDQKAALKSQLEGSLLLSSRVLLKRIDLQPIGWVLVQASPETFYDSF